MRVKISRISAALVFVASVVIAGISPAVTVLAAADTCTWTGADSANWSDGDNWSGCDNGGVPENGDTLIFPAGASNKTTNNDISNLQVATITINDGGYTLAGNSFTITNITAITANAPATISANVTYNSGSHVTILAASHTTLALNGVSNFVVTGFYEVNIGSLTNDGYDGKVDFAGNVIGDAGAQFIAVAGAVATLEGASNTFVADQVGAESGATFECRSANCFGDDANDIYTGGGIIRLFASATYANNLVTSTPAENNAWVVADQDVSITGDVTVNDSLGLSQVGTSKSLQFTGAVTLNEGISTFGSDSTSVIRFDGAVGGPGGFSAGSGTTKLAGSNTFEDIIFVNNDAIVEASTVSSLGSTDGGTVVLDGGSLTFNTASGFTVNEPITINGDGNANSAGAINNVGVDNVTLAGAITLGSDATVSNVATGTTLELSGVIGGTGDLTYVGHAGGAYIEVAGASPNSYSGDTTVAGGVVYFLKTGAIPGDLDIISEDPDTNPSHAYFYDSSDVMADTGVISMNSNEDSHITFGEDDEVIGGLQGSGGVVQVQTNGDRVIIDQDFDSTYGGVFYTDGNAATIEKRGSGVLTLTGDYQFIGDEITFVAQEGTLVINGDVRTTSGGNVAVTGGTLKGVGTVNDVTTAGGTVSPGNSPGKLSVGDLTLDASSTLQVEINGPTAGTEYDQIESSGMVNLGGATLSLSPGYTPAANQAFTIITASSVTGTFNGLPNGSTVTVNGLTFRVAYNATSVTLTYLSGAYVASGSLGNTGTNIMVVITAALLLITVGLLASRGVLLAKRYSQE